ncbi:MAG: hypothetical protein WC635_04205 [Bacteriovorax sp.]|jgi:hypothetical protein
MGSNNGKSPFEEFVDSKSAEDKKINWNARKKLWLEKVNDLYTEIDKWFLNLKKSGKITISKEDLTIHEEQLGTYISQKLIIRIGGEKIVLSPVGTIIIGGYGRIDITGKAGDVMLILSHQDYRPGVTVHVSTSSQEAEEYKKKQQQERNARPELTRENLIWLYVRRGHRLEYFPLTKSIFEEIIMAVSGS